MPTLYRMLCWVFEIRDETYVLCLEKAHNVVVETEKEI